MAKNISISVATIGAGLWNSPDGGDDWHRAGGIWGDSRVFIVTVHPDNPNVLFVAGGESPFGGSGNIQRSKDRGQTWEAVPLPVEPNTPIWAFGAHAADPDFIMA